MSFVNILVQAWKIGPEMKACLLVLADLAYFVFVALLLKVVEYFFGEKRLFRLCQSTVAQPAIIQVAIVNWVYKIFQFPSRLRNERLLEEVFGIISLDWEVQGANQAKVDKALKDLAAEANRAFDWQEQQRKGTDKQALRNADDWAERAKKAFWQAHRLARTNYFSAKNSIREY